MTEQTRHRAPTEVQLQISALDAGGLGCAELNERPVRVRNALPGEQVTARILRKRKGMRYADAVSVEAHSSSADRVPSACAGFPRCGGCALHHLDYAQQLAHKQSQLADALRAQGVAVGDWMAPVSTGRLNYRRKARLGVRQLGEQVLVGFRESFSNRVARLDACPALTEALSALIAPLKTLIAQLSVADKIPQIEVSQGDGSCVLMLRHLAPLNDDDLQHLRDFQTRYQVTLLLQPGGYDTLQQLDGARPAELGYALPDSGLYMHFAPHQFTQVNLAMNQMLARYVIAHLGGVKGSGLHQVRVADLFCGIGNLSLPLARAGARVWGYEVASEAVDMAWSNARRNGIDARTHFAALDLYEDGIDLPRDIEVLVLDPPRSGAGPNLPRWLGGFSGARAVYVSCNPVTFAADAAQFAAHGFELHKVGIFDMFPHTAHVETMGLFLRTGGSA